MIRSVRALCTRAWGPAGPLKNLSLVENAETVPLHFTLELECLRDHGNYVWWNTFMLCQARPKAVGVTQYWETVTLLESHNPWFSYNLLRRRARMNRMVMKKRSVESPAAYVFLYYTRRSATAQNSHSIFHGHGKAFGWVSTVLMISWLWPVAMVLGGGGCHLVCSYMHNLFVDHHNIIHSHNNDFIL